MRAKQFCVVATTVPRRRFAASKMHLKIVNEYDQEIPQSQTADNPVAP